MNKLFIRKNLTLFAIILFIIIFFGTTYFKPLFLYKNDGSLRTFGVGYKQKTILPIWLYAILLGVACYLVVLFYVSYSNIRLN